MPRPYKRWTEADDQQLTQLYPTHSNPQIATQMGRNCEFIKQKARALGLSKQPGFASYFQKHISTGRHTRFGASGAYKVKAIHATGTVLWHEERGHNPAQYYIYLGKKKPMPLKRWLWKTWVGDLTKGFVIRFKDANPRRCVLSNLECIPRSEHAKRNHNRQKASDTIRSGQASDSYYASRLYMKNKAMRAFVIAHAPDLIDTKRAQIKLKNQLKDHE